MATKYRDPTSDISSTGTWSPSTNRYAQVNDYPDASSTKLQGGTATSTCLFGFSAFDVPANSTGISVQVLYYDGEPASGNNNTGAQIVVGGTPYLATTHNPSGTTGTSRSDNWANNPKSGVAWTVADVNGSGGNALQQFGINSTDSNPVFWWASARIQVTYTPPPTGDLSKTLDSATTAGTGNVLVKGSLTKTLDGATVAGTGHPLSGPVADLSVTLGSATVSGTGSRSRMGTLSKTLDSAGVSGQGKVTVKGSLAKTLDSATLTGTGLLEKYGILSKTLDSATVAATGAVTSGPTANLSKVLDSLTGSGDGSIPLKVISSVTLADAGVSGTGLVLSPCIGDLGVVLGDVMLLGRGRVSTPGTLATNWPYYYAAPHEPAGKA